MEWHAPAAAMQLPDQAYRIGNAYPEEAEVAELALSATDFAEITVSREPYSSSRRTIVMQLTPQQQANLKPSYDEATGKFYCFTDDNYPYHHGLSSSYCTTMRRRTHSNIGIAPVPPRKAKKQ